jgi:hypothetical protein
MSAHWGTFTKEWNYRECLSAASNAVTDYSLKLYDEAGDGDYIVIGARNDLVVQVTCVPQGERRTWLAVTAWSPNSATAEQARNTIREKIVRLVHID